MTENQLITMRLRHVLEERSVSTDSANLASWAKAHGLNPTTFLNQFRTHAYTLHTIQVLNVALHDVSSDWLLYGIGYAYRDPHMVHVVNNVSGNAITQQIDGNAITQQIDGTCNTIDNDIENRS